MSDLDPRDRLATGAKAGERASPIEAAITPEMVEAGLRFAHSYLSDLLPVHWPSGPDFVRSLYAAMRNASHTRPER